MSTPLSPRIEQGAPFLLAGVRKRILFTELFSAVPLLWEELVPLLPLPGQVGRVTYGAGCGVNEAEGWFEYMAAVEVSDFALVPAGLGRMRVPACRYAVFTHEGHVNGLRGLWERIWEDWYPTSGFQAADTPDFERYDERFDPITSTGVAEIWFPITG